MVNITNEQKHDSKVMPELVNEIAEQKGTR